MRTKDLKLYTLTKDEVMKSNVSTAFSGYIKANYSELFQILGEPTYNLNDGLDKTNFEWFILFKGQVFTIYDWKCTPAYSLQERYEWHIGSQWRPNAGLISTDEFIQELNERVSNIRNENVFSDKIFVLTVKK